MTDREQDLRLRCLELANCQQFNLGKSDDIIASARKMYGFVNGLSEGGLVGGIGAQNTLGMPLGAPTLTGRAVYNP